MFDIFLILGKGTTFHPLDSREFHREVALVDLHQAASQILAGTIRGRVVVNVNLKTPQLAAEDACL